MILSVTNLADRVKGKVPVGCRKGKLTTLTSEDQDKLANYLVKLAEMGIGRLKLLSCLRLVHTSCHCRAVEKATLSKLRKKTGFPFVNCKKALVKFDNDIKQAEAWLREQAQKEGWAKATKLQGRHMSQGLIGLVLDNNIGAMVEVNCETDFVARNQKFQQLVSEVAHTCLKVASSSADHKGVLSGEDMGKLKTEDGNSLADKVALQVGNIGENMGLRRATYLKSPPGNCVGYYIHSSGTKSGVDVCKMGKYGALVTFTQPTSSGQDTLTTKELGRQLAQHVVGMNPSELGNPDDVILCEKKEMNPPSDTDQASDTPVNDTLTESSQDETTAETATESIKPEEHRMLFQEFLLDSDLNVYEFLQQNGTEVVDYIRLECGEELPDN